MNEFIVAAMMVLGSSAEDKEVSSSVRREMI